MHEKGKKMVELKNVSKSYCTKAGQVRALDGVSVLFPSTGLIFILGKSGSGKTTLLNVIGGLDGIDEGEIYIQEEKLSHFSAQEYDSYRNTVVGFVFQEYNLLAEYTVEYNIKIAMELQGRSVEETEFEKLLKDFEIEELRNRNPSELSGGQRQRVAIARALVKQPRIIMADEPTGALDSATGAQVLDTLKKLSKDKLVIVVSHDNEFAEKYADRILRLVDGKIVEDITFTEKELSSNVSEQANSVIVKEGADLSLAEKDVLAKAVKERKSIQLTERLCFRDKAPTGEVVVGRKEPVAFKKSKMKVKTSAYLGTKSLVSKPIRLFFTILISAFAFAVFGLFDTIANFTVQKSLLYCLDETPSTVVATADYIADKSAGDTYNIKVSDETLGWLKKETGGEVKGIFDFRNNTTGKISYSQSIVELSETGLIVGRRYYSNSINGFIEFDDEQEIKPNGKFKDFDYTLVAGEYPRLRFVDDQLQEDSLYEVAISEYFADSVIYYLNGRKLNDKTIQSREDLLGCTLSVGQDAYKIVGIIDCGQIPEKYDQIKVSAPRNDNLNALFDDYNVFINAGAQKCFFVADGFRDTINKKNSAVDIFYAGNTETMITLSNPTVKKQLADYVYNNAGYGEENIFLFSGEYPAKGSVSLADDEILIHCYNLEYLLTKEIAHLYYESDRQSVRTLLRGLERGTKESVRAAFGEILQSLGKTEMDSVTATVDARSTKTGETFSKQVKIVGFYFGVGLNNSAVASEFKCMMNDALMSELSIYPEQGDYTHILFSKQSVQSGAEVIAKYLTSERGFSLIWYQNSVLSIIRENEPIVRQAADLFLYAALALAGFSIFMLYNYISASIANKRRSVGVLRGLGAGGKDILLIFLFESLLIGLINGLLANALCVLGCALVNAYIMNTMNIFVSFAMFGGRQLLIILLMSLSTAVVSSVLPIIKISKKKPVELIRRK
jgi:ABC-type lipoprotein export system ATPase subunit